MSVREIEKNLYAVGAADYAIRNFHGYLTPRGSTYNAYLILDDKNVLIDTVKRPFTADLLDNIRELLPLEKLDYIVLNHVEPDHSGALPTLAHICPKAKILCTAAAQKEVLAYYKEDMNFEIVGAGDTLSTGQRTLQFIPMPMVHWPDSMCTFIPEDGLLLSNDAFGQHVAVEHKTDTEIGKEQLLDYAANYYANIVLPFGGPVQKLLGQAAGLNIKKIAPSHGVIIESYVSEMVQKYQDWSTGKTDTNKAVIAFDTMYGSTRTLAAEKQEDLVAKGYHVTFLNMAETHVSTALHAMLEADYIAVGSSTLNKQVMPSVGALLCYMKGLAPKNRKGWAFGAYGWSGESTGIIEETLKTLNFQLEPTRKVQWRP